MGCSEGHFDNITPIFIALPQKTAYLKSYDNEPKWMYFFTDDEFLKYYICIWSKVCRSIRKELDSEPVFDNKFFKAKKDLVKILQTFMVKMCQK